ncbi:TPA: YopX family protein [Streptococcus suis]
MIPRFRGWIKSKRKLLPVFQIIWHKGDISRILTVEGVVLDSHLAEDVVLMQSTGLFDVNGKEIFEGDVVKLRYTISSDYEFFKVTRFRGGSWRIDNRRRGCELWLRNEDCEIIGNIYENPELVEG